MRRTIAFWCLLGLAVPYQQCTCVGRGLPRQMPTGECLHGFVSDCLDNDTCPTIFPDALASASSFNDSLFEAIGRQISIEGRAVDNIAAAGPRDAHGQYSGPLKPHGICW